MKKNFLTITILLIICVLILSLAWSYFRNSLDAMDITEGEASETYERHYALIPEDENSVLWQSVYESASAWAAENHAYLELISQEGGSTYTTADYLRILIASKVDGIILKPDGTDEIRNLIDEAVESGIPVVTVLEDDSESQRISYVGLNSYQLADVYTEYTLSLLNGGAGGIMVLLDSESVNPVQSLAASQLTRYLDEQKADGQELNVSLYYLDNASDFDLEESIRELFVTDSQLPDILICMDETVTECAYQTLVDYNAVGSTSIIGFYYTDQILDAIEKDIIPVTLVVDTAQIGTCSIDALEEFHSLGHTSSYYNIGLSLITTDNVSEYQEESTEGEDI
ncbi:MAG: substrate-binding domain-containing protein [Lachnospiraceae bacterium]|nr:substrate-binding domain-containing protein [Lachnospiraceae bacterium]